VVKSKPHRERLDVIADVDVPGSIKTSEAVHRPGRNPVQSFFGVPQNTRADLVLNSSLSNGANDCQEVFAKFDGSVLAPHLFTGSDALDLRAKVFVVSSNSLSAVARTWC
jgi:hypothetical protein